MPRLPDLKELWNTLCICAHDGCVKKHENLCLHAILSELKQWVAWTVVVFWWPDRPLFCSDLEILFICIPQTQSHISQLFTQIVFVWGFPALAAFSYHIVLCTLTLHCRITCVLKGQSRQKWQFYHLFIFMSIQTYTEAYVHHGIKYIVTVYVYFFSPNFYFTSWDSGIPLRMFFFLLLNFLNTWPHAHAEFWEAYIFEGDKKSELQDEKKK